MWGFCSLGATSLGGAAFGQGSGPVLLQNMGCQGTEQRIVDCVSHGMGYSTCRHSFDAGIICEPGNELGLASNNNKIKKNNN